MRWTTELVKHPLKFLNLAMDVSQTLVYLLFSGLHLLIATQPIKILEEIIQIASGKNKFYAQIKLTQCF